MDGGGGLPEDLRIPFSYTFSQSFWVQVSIFLLQPKVCWVISFSSMSLLLTPSLPFSFQWWTAVIPAPPLTVCWAEISLRSARRFDTPVWAGGSWRESHPGRVSSMGCGAHLCPFAPVTVLTSAEYTVGPISDGRWIDSRGGRDECARCRGTSCLFTSRGRRVLTLRLVHERRIYQCLSVWRGCEAFPPTATAHTHNSAPPNP